MPKLKVIGSKGKYKIKNTDTGITYKTTYKSKKDANLKKFVIQNWFLKR